MTAESKPNCFDINEFPPAIESPYLVGTLCEFFPINSPIAIYQGPMELHSPDVVLKGTGDLRIDWFPIPSVRFNFSSFEFWKPTLAGPVKLHLTDREVLADAYITWFNARAVGVRPNGGTSTQSTQQNTVLRGIVLPTHIGSPGQAASVIFHLPNFFACNGSKSIRNGDSTRIWGGRLQYRFGDWDVTLDRLPGCDSQFLVDLSRAGGYAVTHLGRIRKSDGTLFALNDAIEMLEALNLLLSFCYGRRTGAVIPVGFDAAGNRVWELWSAVDVARACPVSSWQADFGRLWIEGLSCAFLRFADCWCQPENRDAVRTAIDWYVEANSRGPGREKEAIVMTQAALELLARAELVERRRALSPRKLDAMNAATKIRKLIDASQTPLAVPRGYDGLQQAHLLDGAPRWNDGPDAFTSIRNSIIHVASPGRAELWKESDWPRWLIEAKELGLWFLERSILHFLGYEGWYKARGVIEPGFGPTEQYFPSGLPPGMTWESSIDVQPKPDTGSSNK